MVAKTKKFKYQTEQFADIKILRHLVPNFHKLPLKQKKLCYFLCQAALSGRDIIYDQNCKHNLLVRKTLEQIIKHYTGRRNSHQFKEFLTYAKRIWVSNGIHHHYATDKLVPKFSKNYFAELIQKSPQANFLFSSDQNGKSFSEHLTTIIFDPKIAAKRVNLDSTQDLVATSANNYYEGITQTEVEAYYKKLNNPNDPTPVSYGLNSKTIKVGNEVQEQIWKIGGLYSEAIEQIVFWLKKAATVSENKIQKSSLNTLIEFYETGNLKKFDEHSIWWIQNEASLIDTINGFIEVYGDPLGKKGAFESLVSLKDLEGTKRAQILSRNAQWFENHSPIDPEFKKKKVSGVAARAIHRVVASGDAGPPSMIGVNLPNADWIRQKHGSKSSTLTNVIGAYIEAGKTDGSLEEFAFSHQEIELAKKYGSAASAVLVDLHEAIGHGSGQIREGVGDPAVIFKNYFSTLEEARADLFALYFLLDPKLVELGVVPSLNSGKTAYDSFILGGLMKQLVRIEPGKSIEESHMRDRQLIAKWVYEKGLPENVIEKKVRKGKTYFVINDYNKLRTLFGALLKEVQRIKSTGDYEAAKALIETYGVQVDQKIHTEVLKRWKKLNIASYSAFINPQLTPVMKKEKIVDVKISYPDDFLTQMMAYGEEYAFLPVSM